MSIRAVIFDFNGVILDDEHLHFEAFAESLFQEKWELTQEMYLERYLGLNDWGFYEAFFADHNSGNPGTRTIDQWVQAKSEVYLRLLADEMPLFTGAKDAIENLAQHIPLAINSGARRHEIEKTLQWADLTSCFHVVFSADEIRNGKPAPDGYVAAFQALREKLPELATLQASECLVIEDAPHGIEAAHAAGMPCAGVAQSQPAADLHQADWVIEKISEFKWDAIVKRFD